MEIGEKIRYLRLEHHLTQKELAEKLHVSMQAISNWERQKDYPDYSNLLQLTELFQISLDELLKEEIDFKERLLKDKFNSHSDVVFYSLVLVVAIIMLGIYVMYRHFHGFGFWLAVVMFIHSVYFFIKKFYLQHKKKIRSV